MSDALAYLLVLTTILLTVYGQLILKWQVLRAGPLPAGWQDRLLFVGHLLLNPWVLSAFAGAFVASLTWMLALSKLPLSTAYPFTAMSLLLVLAFSAAFLGEPISLAKVIGSVMIVGGIVFVSTGT